MKYNKGFTLIELVVVIVILGILAATALPKFINLQGDAGTAAGAGVAGALSSAGAINYSKWLISSGSPLVTSVTGTPAVAQGNALVTGVTFAAAASGNTYGLSCTACAGTVGAKTSTCTVSSSQTGATTTAVVLACTE